MKTANKFIVILSGALLTFFLTGLACFVFFTPGTLIYNLLIAQLIVFSLAAISVILYNTTNLFRENRVSERSVTKIVLLSESNSPKEEFTLVGRTSLLIGKRDEVYIRSEIDLALDGYAVINLVENNWYVERIFDERSIGLKRAGEQFVYRLKTGMSYRLQINDILYIGNERLLVA